MGHAKQACPTAFSARCGPPKNNYSGAMGRALFVFASLAILISGCTKPEAAFVGKWQLDPSSIKYDTSIKNDDPKMGAAYPIPPGAMVLEFRLDKTFSISSVQGDRTGTFQLDGTAGTLTFTNPQTDADKQPLTLTLKSDGKSLTVTGKGPVTSMKFNKL